MHVALAGVFVSVAAVQRPADGWLVFYGAAVAMLARWVTSRRYALALVGLRTPPPPEVFTAALEEACSAMGAAAPVVRYFPDAPGVSLVVTPTIGAPRVLALGSGWAGAPRDVLVGACAHELAHIAAHDYKVSFVHAGLYGAAVAVAASLLSTTDPAAALTAAAVVVAGAHLWRYVHAAWSRRIELNADRRATRAVGLFATVSALEYSLRLSADPVNRSRWLASHPTRLERARAAAAVHVRGQLR